MRRFLEFIVLYCLCCLPCATQTVGSNARVSAMTREIAFTIDDLPFAADASDLRQIERVTKKILASLVAHRVPAIGFVNEQKLYVKGETDARIDVLRQWLDAGMLLGNHTFSHADLNAVPLAQYEDEFVRGETVTRALMRERGNEKLYFRYPYNHTGATREVKESFQAFLKSRGYEIAPFTIEHDDYIFAAVYEKARRKADAALMQRIRAAYLEHLDVKFDYYERRSRELLGREPKQIFLIHANELNADCLDEMTAKLEKRDYRFITLEQALQDEAYRIKDEYVGKAGISWLHRWAISLGKNPDYRDDPDPPQFIMSLYQTK